MLKILFTFIFCFILLLSYGQMQVTLTPQINTLCNGGCNYNGPTIMINEVMIKPVIGNGYMYSVSAFNPAGEWIELYNPDKCNAIDISCYFLGNNAPCSGGDCGGGFELPQGTIIPPRGFLIVRGDDATPVPANLLVQNGGRTLEVVITGTPSVCVDGSNRLWFPDNGGWFAFYDENGVPQDAITWGSPNNSDLNGYPCNPVNACPFLDTLCSYNQIPVNRKTNISSGSGSTGMTFRRIPDGGSWGFNTQGSSTLGDCNTTCVPPPVITCNGSISTSVSGGIPPYKYTWNDIMLQTTQTAVSLCKGTYCVTVTDSAGQTVTECITIEDFKPSVWLDTISAICANDLPTALSGGSPPGGVYSGPGVSAGFINPLIAGPGDHQVTYTFYNADSCQNSDTRIIRIYSLPEITFGPLTPLCINSLPVNLEQLPSPLGGGFFGPGISGTNFNPGITGPGNFILNYFYTDQNSCTDTVSSPITVNILPVVSLDPFDSICVNADSIELSGGLPPGGDYSGNGVVSNYFYPSLAGIGNILIVYSYTDSNSCTNNAIQTIVVMPGPSLQFQIQPDICVGTAAFSLTGGSPAGGTYSGTAVSGGIFDPLIAGLGPHIITYSLTGANGCIGKISQVLTIRELPEVGISPFPIVCADDQPLQLTSGYPQGGTYSGLGVNAGYFDPGVTGVGNFPLVYTYKDQYGCENDSTRTIIVYPLPQKFDITGGGEICDDGPGVNVGLQNSQAGVHYQLLLNGAGIGSLVYGTGDSLDFGKMNDSGSYTVIAVDSLSGCDMEMNGIAYIEFIQVPGVNLPDSTWLCDPVGVYLDAGSFAPDTVTYLWQDGSTNRYLIALQPGIYSVLVGKSECYGSDTIEVKVCSELWLPNVFTPNDDGKNDRFLPKVTGDIVKYRIDVFDRWGTKVFESDDMFEGWDGRRFNKGSLCGDGVYFFTATYLGLGKSYPPYETKVSGSVTLLR